MRYVETTPAASDDPSGSGSRRSQRSSSLRVDARRFALLGVARRARLAWHASRNLVRRELPSVWLSVAPGLTASSEVLGVLLLFALIIGLAIVLAAVIVSAAEDQQQRERRQRRREAMRDLDLKRRIGDGY